MWTGWRWAGGRWVKLCDGRTIGDAHRRLNAALSGKRLATNLHAALTGGAPPTWNPDKTEPRRPFEDPEPEGV